MAEFRDARGLARLVLGKEPQGRDPRRSRTMQKFELLAFSAGLILTGFLSLVAVPLA
jgi:hypothetical protein